MKKAALFLLGCVLLGACSGKDSFSPDDGDMQRALNVSLFESKDSQKKWILRADEVDFADLNSAVLHNPRLLLRENGQDSAQVSGDRGTFNYSQKLVSIEGNAQVRSFKEKVTLSTDRFFYDVDKDRIWSDKKTIIVRGPAKITARGGIETDSKLVKIEFKKQSTQLPHDLKQVPGVKA